MTECPHCHKDIALANPSGFCSHIYYPDNCAVCSAPERARLRLNAAAPDLLEAAKAARECIKWLPNIPENVEAMDALDAAISAAEGVE